jgi:hypothetical protein
MYTCATSLHCIYDAHQTYTNVQIQREREEVREMRKGRNTKGEGEVVGKSKREK